MNQTFIDNAPCDSTAQVFCDGFQCLVMARCRMFSKFAQGDNVIPNIRATGDVRIYKFTEERTEAESLLGFDDFGKGSVLIRT